MNKESKLLENVNDQTILQEQTIKTLKRTIKELILEQDQIVEFEKMKAINGLVSGIAHELNTPLGIGITAASLVETKIMEVQNKLEKEALDVNTLLSNMSIISQSTNLLLNNLNRAVLLINNLKMTSVTTNADNPVKFNLSNYLMDIIQCLKFKEEISSSGHIIITDFPQNIYICSYPLVFREIISTLVDNSIIHGFENRSRGLIQISVIEESLFYIFKYRDNGQGLDNHNRKRIFEPFFTTKMGQRCSGLGMNIVYNLVIHKMNGQIACISKPGEGLEVVITLKK